MPDTLLSAYHSEPAFQKPFAFLLATPTVLRPSTQSPLLVLNPNTSI